jgi:DNA gyrase subunit B
MQWNTTFSESVHTFANTINTARGRHPRGGLPRGADRLVNNCGEDEGA